MNAQSPAWARPSVGQFFHIPYSVEHTRYAASWTRQVRDHPYTSCCNADKGIHYYTTTYGNHQITGWDYVTGCELDGGSWRATRCAGLTKLRAAKLILHTNR